MEAVKRTDQLMTMPDCRSARILMGNAHKFAELKKPVDCIDCYIQAFQTRFGDDYLDDPLWIEFYRAQFATYLLTKMHLGCTLAEGDMIHDYIREWYEDLCASFRASEIRFRGSVRRWLSRQKMDFPIDADGLFSSF